MKDKKKFELRGNALIESSLITGIFLLVLVHVVEILAVLVGDVHPASFLHVINCTKNEINISSS